MAGLATQVGMFVSADTGGLPAKNDVVLNNVNFSAPTSGIQTITSSSRLNAANAPEFACNGSTSWSANNRWLSSAGALPAWWKIDLGETKAFYSYRIHTKSETYSIQDHTIDVSLDGTSWTEVHEHTGALNNNLWTELDVTTPSLCRYIRLNVTNETGATSAGMSEIEVRS